MLEFISGKILNLNPDNIIIQSGGFGIKITATTNTIKDLKEQEETSIPTYLSIQETKWEIFGFSNKKEREAFLLLISIRGIGPKAAINILNSLTPGDLKDIAQGSDTNYKLEQISGIGKKTAARIVVELKQKEEQMNWANSVGGKAISQPQREDLIKALENLGYRSQEIKTTINELPNLPENLGEAIREVLKHLGKR